MLHRHLRWVLLAIPVSLAGQEAAGTQLWRVAAATLPIPTALATGGAGAFWNPAQLIDSARVRLSIEGIQTPATVGATGVLATAIVRIDRAVRVGLVYGHMGLGGLVRTSYSPDEDEGSIPYYTEALAGVWSGTFRSTTVGAALGYHEVRLDQVVRNRITFDVGASQRINDVLRVAAATHFFSHFQTNHPAQDLYGAVDFRFFRGPLWDGGPVANLRARYGVALDGAFPLLRLEAAAHQVSSDGTEKFLWRLNDGEAVESVIIPEGKRRTLCISSQVGCALGCVFCATGRMGWRRNLSPAEIAGQVREIVLRAAARTP